MVSLHSTSGAGSSHKGKVYGILAGKLFDSVERRMRSDQVIMIDPELGIILDVVNMEDFRRSEDSDIELFEFGKWTFTPGFVDAHVHSEAPNLFSSRGDNVLSSNPVFLHAYSETSWNDQITKESLAERTIRATVHAQKTLLAGFTTVR
jgi:cytosine/adenosine deaminase-related metal-dependent hydrolase